MNKARPKAATKKELATGAEKPKKIVVKKPTPKQQKAARLLLDNSRKKGKTKTKGQVLIEAGYSPKVAAQPSRVLDSRGFREIFDEMIPDTLINEAHKGLLTAKKGVYFEGVRVGEEPNHDAIARGVDMAHKVKGTYAPERHLTGDIGALLEKTDEELDEIIARESQVMERFSKHKPKQDNGKG